MQAIYHITLGRLHCGDYRELLENLKFRGYKIEWLESRGWLDRRFTVKGDLETVKKIKQITEKWCHHIDSDDE